VSSWPNACRYLEGYRNKMFANKVEYDEDCGVIEIS
jgi:hypothetical protein